MARDKIKSEPIDGFVYEVTQLPATQGWEIGTELVAMVVPMIGALAGEGKSEAKEESLADLDLRALGLKAMAEVLAREISSPRLREIRKLVVEQTEIYGEGFGDAGASLTRNFDDHFAGRYDALLEWFLFALEVNFGGFFVGFWERIKKRFPALQALPTVPSNLQSTSTGESGNPSLPM